MIMGFLHCMWYHLCIRAKGQTLQHWRPGWQLGNNLQLVFMQVQGTRLTPDITSKYTHTEYYFFFFNTVHAHEDFLLPSCHCNMYFLLFEFTHNKPCSTCSFFPLCSYFSWGLCKYLLLRLHLSSSEPRPPSLHIENLELPLLWRELRPLSTIQEVYSTWSNRPSNKHQKKALRVILVQTMRC